MTTVTIIGADETCEVARLPHYEAGVQYALDALGGAVCEPEWTEYSGRPCSVWCKPQALDLNLDASALYLINHGEAQSALDDFKLFGPIAIVQEN